MSNDKDVVTVGALKSILNEMLDQELAIVHETREEVEKIKMKVKEQGYRIEDDEIYSRRNNFVFHRVLINVNENPLQVTMDLGREIGVQINQNDIHAAHRLPSRNQNSPPPFIMKKTYS